MKSPFLLPLHLLAWFALFLLLLTATAMVAAWLPLSAGGAVAALGAVLGSAASIAERCLPAALLPAVFLTGLRAARNPVSRPFSLLLPSVTVVAILLAGPWALEAIGSASPEKATAAAGYVVPGALTRAVAPDGREAVFVARSADPAASLVADVTVLRASPPERRLVHYAAGVVSVEPFGATVRLGGGPPEVPSVELALPRAPVLAELAAPQAVTAALADDLGWVAGELRRARGDAELDAVLLSLGLAAFLWFSTSLFRTTRWPLLSGALLAVLWRGALAALRFAGEEIRPALAGAMGADAELGLLARSSPALLLAAAGALFLAFDLALLRFDFWKRELEG